jgi:hypothetical protein
MGLLVGHEIAIVMHLIPFTLLLNRVYLLSSLTLLFKVPIAFKIAMQKRRMTSRQPPKGLGHHVILYGSDLWAGTGHKTREVGCYRRNLLPFGAINRLRKHLFLKYIHASYACQVVLLLP